MDGLTLPRATHPRARAARYRGWFQGGYRWLWTLLGLVLIAALAASITLGWPLGAQLIIGGALLWPLQGLAWWKLYLRELPPQTNSPDGLDVNRVAESAVLGAALKAEHPKQLWQQVQEEWAARFICHRLLLDPSPVIEQVSQQPADMPAMWQEAYRLSQSVGASSITVGGVVAAILLGAPGAQTWLQQQELQPENVLNVLDWQQRTDEIMRKLQQKHTFGGIARDWAAGYTPLLNRFGHDLSRDIEHGAYRHLYLQTHSELLDQMQTRLAHPTQNALALVGKTGSGKTSLVYALAERLLSSKQSDLAYYKIFSIDASAVVSEANRSGNLEAIMLRLVTEANRAGNIILFFDDAHNFFSSEAGARDMTNILVQMLQANAVKTVFALNPNDWQYLVSNATDLTARLQPLQMQEPEQATIEKVLEDQSLAIEAETGMNISYQAIKEAYRLAQRYTLEQSFPGKGISLLKSATANAVHGWVIPSSVQQTVEAMTGTKVAAASAQERDVLLNLEERLHERMVNQQFAVKVVSDALRRARAGVRSQNRPIGSFLFLGPTGVGKTELSKALASTYFGGEDHIVRLDMSEYNSAESAQRLLAPAGDPGTFLTNIRTQPFSVVLLDEVEKASGEVLNLLLQMLDEGSLTDTNGLEVSFKDAIVITTSNAGADIIRANIDSGQGLEDFAADFTDQLVNDNYFRPELINRFDEVVLFRPLNKDELMEVLQLLLGEVNRNLAQKQIGVRLSRAAAEALVEQGYDPRLGARPMRRTVQRTVENVVAKRLLEGQLQPGDQTTLDVADLKLEEAADST